MTSYAPHVALTACRSCGARPLHELHAFGDTPIADRLIDPAAPREDLRAPLSLVLCDACGLAQIRETVDPEVLFDAHYPYYSSVSTALLAHFHASADALIAAHALDENSFVVEAASNDGYMLRRFKAAGIPVLGIDPSDGPVAVARAQGVETINGFFSLAQALEITATRGRADLFLANNVLAHVADTNDFVAGIAEVLSDTGTAVLEFPYVVDLVDHRAFDTIYHQHLLYLSLTSAAAIFARHGLRINDVERIAVHGGSLRISVSRRSEASPRVAELRVYEADRSVGNHAFFAPMLDDMRTLRGSFRALLEEYRKQGVRLAGYGAAAKATTLMHHIGVSRGDLTFIVDKSKWKQGLEMPGTRIPIVSPEALAHSEVGAVVVLAWNFANEIMAENRDFAARGGEFVVPIPDLVVTQGAQMRAAL